MRFPQVATILTRRFLIIKTDLRQTFSFFFSVPPDILDYATSSDIIVREGANVNLHCVAKGFPTPSIIWKRESGDLITLADGKEGKPRVFVFGLENSFTTSFCVCFMEPEKLWVIGVFSTENCTGRNLEKKT